MGITGELVRSVFSKNRSLKTHETNVKINNAVEKKRWKTSVKSYLCGDDLFNSIQAEEDSASVKSSEATVMHIFLEDGYSTEDIQSQDTSKYENSDRDHSSSRSYKSFDEDAAATIIQSVFRGFKVRCLKSAGLQNDFAEGMKSPSRESGATSIEVQTRNSTGVVSIQGEDPSVSTKLQLKPKYSVYKPKEDWDDSTLNSTLSKMRIQNRQEAMTRRERALAYSFSQQLRVCSKKKHTKSDGTEPNMGWNWLERWMATRQTEVSPVEDCLSKQLINNEAATTMKTRPFLKNQLLDLSFEEKESCGSNDVPVQVDSSLKPDTHDKHGCEPARNRQKAPRKTSRRNSLPSYHYQKEHSKMSRKDGPKEDEKDKRQKAKHTRSNSVCTNDASWLPLDHFGQNSKSDP